MGKSIKFSHYGCGKTGRIIIEYALEKGYELLSVYDMNPSLIGRDVGMMIGIGKIGIRVSDAKEAEGDFKTNKPDICIITTRSLMRDVKDIMMICAKNGVNAVTTCEEAIFPWNSSPHTTQIIHEVSMANNCTITGTGGQETQYASLFALFGGGVQKANLISGMAQYNVEDYGIALAEGHGIGLTETEFMVKIAATDDISQQDRDELIENEEFLPSYVWNTNGWICDFLGLTITEQTQKCVPKIAQADVFSKALGRVIRKGQVIGMGAIVTTNTKEHIAIEAECSGIVYQENDEDLSRCSVYGEPDMECVLNKLDIVRITCATVVNRIPDVINADSGYVTTSKMPIMKYKVAEER